MNGRTIGKDTLDGKWVLGRTRGKTLSRDGVEDDSPTETLTTDDVLSL